MTLYTEKLERMKMTDIYSWHPTDSLDLIKEAIDRYEKENGEPPKHLVVPRIYLNSLKEMRPSKESFEITAVCGVSVSSSEETVVLEP